MRCLWVLVLLSDPSGIGDLVLVCLLWIILPLLLLVTVVRVIMLISKRIRSHK